ncbi:MAG: DUF1559 domain-containing protein [Planctomycetaceae bacterium]
MGSAFHLYHDVFGHFPRPRVDWKARRWQDQHPHSWRVAVLPYVGAGDSRANIALTSRGIANTTRPSSNKCRLGLSEPER